MAEAWSGWAKIVRTIAATASWACLGTTEVPRPRREQQVLGPQNSRSHDFRATRIRIGGISAIPGMPCASGFVIRLEKDRHGLLDSGEDRGDSLRVDHLCRGYR